MITICTGIKNRTEALKECLIESMLNCEGKNFLELSVFDCGSNDVSDVKKDIKKIWDGKLRYKRVNGSFTRAHSLNGAVRQATSEWLFLCDADMTLPVDFVDQYLENVSKEKAWFPICFSLGRGKPRVASGKNGWWRTSGFGMVGLPKSHFMEIGGFNEPGYRRWGGEDNDLHNRIKLEKIRKQCVGLFHNWHESPQNVLTTPAQFR